jgi:hypothetical protein
MENNVLVRFRNRSGDYTLSGNPERLVSEMSDLEFLRTMLEISAGTGAGIAGLGAAAGLARAAWRAGGQFGADIEMQHAAIHAQTELEKAKALLAQASADRTAALHPRSVTYSPHYAPHTSSQAVPAASVAMETETDALELPGMVDLADIGHVPSVRSILLGLAPGGAPLTVSAKELMHTGLLGASGGGKSNTGRLILTQLLACGVDCVIADPHFALYDTETGEDWQPIASRLKMSPAVKAGDIGDMFGWMGDELSRRKERRTAGERVGSPLVAYVDELPSIVSDVPGAMDTLSRILREGRKYAIYLVTAAQDMLVRTLKTGGEIRENLRTAIYSGGAIASAVPLVDMTKREIGQFEERLGRGVVLLRSQVTPQATLARVPLASNEAVVRLLSDDAPTMPNWTADGQQRDGKADGTDAAPQSAGQLSAEAARVRALFAGGMALNDIIREVKNVNPAKGGRAVQKAREEVEALLREVLA